MIRRPPRSTRTDTLFPYTTLFRSSLAFSLQTADGIIDDVAGLTAFLDERLPREEPGKETGTAGAKSNSFAVADLWRTLIDLEEEFVPSATIGDKLAETSEGAIRSEEHTSELQSLMRISYAVFGLKKK